MVLTSMPKSLKKVLNRSSKKIRHVFYVVFEFIVVGMMRIVIPRLSRCTEKKLAVGLGNFLFVFGGSSKRIALANLDIVYKTKKTPIEKKAIMKAAYRHAALVMLDYFWFSRETFKRLDAFCRVESDEVNQWISGTSPGIFVTAHIGNWELAGQYVASRGRAMWSVYRPIGTRKTLRTLLDFRKATGQKVIARDGAMVGMLRALHSNGLVALVLDQHTEVIDGGVYVDFFSLPATFSNSPGVLAKRLGVPICVVCAIHDAVSDQYVLKSYDVISAHDIADMSPEAIPARIAKGISTMILDNPEQWLWGYRRWKRYRAQDDPDKFPFYAKKDAYS